MNIPIVYEDEWLVICNKPSGLLTVPTPKNETRTLTSILNDDLKERGLTYRLHPCHRLDRETSGLIIYAKGKSAQQKMMDLFRARQVSKYYIAFVSGNLKTQDGKINKPIEGQSALTRYHILEIRNGFDIVEVMPLTGRTNQIRIHFKEIGHPILGESKFAFRRDFEIKAKRLMLHSGAIDFIHPFSQKKLQLDTELPNEMQKFLEEHE